MHRSPKPRRKNKWLYGSVIVFALLLSLGSFSYALVSTMALARTSATVEVTSVPQLAEPESEKGNSETSVEEEPVLQQQGISTLANPVWINETARVTGIPARALQAYAGADLKLRQEHNCVLGWNTLAAIGWIESQHGSINGASLGADGNASPMIVGIALDGTTTALIQDTDEGELDGDTVYDRAVGPMQFIPQTWYQWGVDGSGDGVADPNNIDDAALSSAYYLCHAQKSLDAAGAWAAAVRSYNDSLEYQNNVAVTARHYKELTH